MAAHECEWDLEGCASAHEARFRGEKDTGREATGPAQSMTMSDTDLGQESRDVVGRVEPTELSSRHRLDKLGSMGRAQCMTACG